MNRHIEDHTSDLRGLIRTDKLLDIFIDALADLIPEIWIVFDAGWDEILSLQLILLLVGQYFFLMINFNFLNNVLT